MKKANILDEMQEQTLLRIEHNMAWLAFYGLLCVILGHLLFLGADAVRYLIGEFIVFFLISGYLVIDCVRKGVWDRRIQPDDKKSGFLLCLAFSLAFAVVLGLSVYRVTGLWLPAVLAFSFSIVILTALSYIAVILIGKLFKKRVTKLESDLDA